MPPRRFQGPPRPYTQEYTFTHPKGHLPTIQGYAGTPGDDTQTLTGTHVCLLWQKQQEKLPRPQGWPGAIGPGRNWVMHIGRGRAQTQSFWGARTRNDLLAGFEVTETEDPTETPG